MKEKWEIKKLGDCFDVIRNGASIKQYDNADGYPITRIETLSNDLFNRDRLGYANIYEIEKYKNFLLKDNDILISHINSTKYLGRAVLYKKQENEKIIHGMNLLNLSGINSNISPDYISYYFKTESYKIQIFKITKKAVNQASFTTTALKEISIPIPPLSVQQSIVAELDTLHRLKELQEQQLAELDNLAQSTFYHLFGDPIENEKGWEVTALGNHISVLGGYAFKSDSFTSDGIPVLKIGNINSGKLNTNNISFYPYDETLSKFTLIQGDLVISLTGTVGKEDYGNVCILPDTFEKYYLNQRNAKIEVLDKLNVIFLKYLMAIPDVKKQLTGISRGVRQANISNNDILSMKSIIPPLSLQTTFAERIEKIEAQKELVKRSIGETQTLIDYTMDKYFG